MSSTNASTETVRRVGADRVPHPGRATLADSLRIDLLKVYTPAFLGRLTGIPYCPLAVEVMRGICELKLKSIGRRVESAYRAAFEWSDDVVTAVVERCNEADSGARVIDRILSGTLLPDLSTKLLSRMAEGAPVERVRVDWDGAGGAFRYEIG